MKWLVLELKLSKVTDIAEKENQEPMRDQVITMESELILCPFVECCSHLTYSEFLISLVICIHETFGLCRMCFENIWTVQNGFWTLHKVMSWAVCILYHIAWGVQLSLCHKFDLRYDELWQTLSRAMILGGKEQDRFRQYLLTFCSECTCTDL